MNDARVIIIYIVSFILGIMVGISIVKYKVDKGFFSLEGDTYICAEVVNEI